MFYLVFNFVKAPLYVDQTIPLRSSKHDLSFLNEILVSDAFVNQFWQLYAKSWMSFAKHLIDFLWFSSMMSWIWRVNWDIILSERFFFFSIFFFSLYRWNLPVEGSQLFSKICEQKIWWRLSSLRSLSRCFLLLLATILAWLFSNFIYLKNKMD